jgi:hypothetical protein
VRIESFDCLSCVAARHQSVQPQLSSTIQNRAHQSEPCFPHRNGLELVRMIRVAYIQKKEAGLPTSLTAHTITVSASPYLPLARHTSSSLSAPPRRWPRRWASRPPRKLREVPVQRG